MFRIMDNKIHVYGRWIGIQSGSHTITIDTETGALSNDGEGTPVCSYETSPSGHVRITSLIPKRSAGSGRVVKGLRVMGFQRLLGRAPLYEDPLGVGDAIETYVEGFLFSFNYYATAYITMAIKPFMWVGGRVCFKSFFTPGGADTGVGYTAIPSSMSCGQNGASTLDSQAPFNGLGINAFANAMSADAFEFYGNSTSLAFSYRSFRKYMFFASNVYGMYETPLGPIGGNDGGFPPSGGSIPDPNSVNFKFSMYSLRQ